MAVFTDLRVTQKGADKQERWTKDIGYEIGSAGGACWIFTLELYFGERYVQLFHGCKLFSIQHSSLMSPDESLLTTKSRGYNPHLDPPRKIRGF